MPIIKHNKKKPKGNDHFDIKKTHGIKNYFQEELKLCKKNWDVCNEAWKPILLIDQCKEFKNDLMNMQQCLHVIFNSKARQISILFQGLEESYEQSKFLVCAKIAAMDKLLGIYKSRLGFFRKYQQVILEKLKDNCLREETEIKDTFENSNGNLLFLLSDVDKRGSNELIKLKNQKGEAIFALESESVGELEKLECEMTEAIEWMIMRLQTTLKTYCYQNHDKIMKYEEMKSKDDLSHKSIFENVDKLRNLKKKVVSSNLEMNNLNQKEIQSLTEKNQKLWEIYYEEKNKSNATALMDQEKLKLLSSEAAKTIKILKNTLKKKERILALKKLCSTYEKPSDRLSGFGDSTGLAFEKLQVFWDTFGRVEAMLPELKKQLKSLEKENVVIKNSLRELVQLFSKSFHRK